MRWIKIDGKNNHDTFAMDTGMGVIVRSIHIAQGVVQAESMVHVPAVKIENNELVPSFDLHITPEPETSQ